MSRKTIKKASLTPSLSLQGRGSKGEGWSVFDLWAPRLIVILVLVVPLLISLDMQDTFDLPKLALVYCADLLLIALWLWQALNQGAIRLHRTILDLPLGVLLLSAGLSTLFSLEPRLSMFGMYRIYIFGLLPMSSFGLLYWFTAQTASEEQAQRVQTAAIVSAAVVCLYGFLQYTGHEIFERMPIVTGGRVWSSLGNPLYMGALSMMGALVVWTQLVRRGEWWRLGFLFLIGSGVVLSLSRSAWLGFLAGAVYVLIVYRHSLKRRTALGLVFLGVFVTLAFMPGVRERASVLFSTQEGSNAARIAGWKAGLKVWWDHPLLGTGPDTFYEAFRPYRNKDYVRAAGPGVTQADAHNDFIQIAATQGAFGLIAFLWVLTAFFGSLRASLTPSLSLQGRGCRVRDGFAAALIALLVQNQFNFSSMATSAWAAVFAGLLIETVHQRNGETETQPHRFPVSPFLRFVLCILLLACPVGLWAVFVPVRADLDFKKGLALAAQGRYTDALRAYQQAVRLQGRIDNYQNEIVNTFQTIGRQLPEGPLRERCLDSAWEVADTVTRQHAHDPDAWNNRGVAAMWLVQLAHRDFQQEAKKSFEHAVSMDPMFVDAWANLAKWEHLAGHLDQEKVLWHKVLEIDPQHLMALQVLRTHAK